MKEKPKIVKIRSTPVVAKPAKLPKPPKAPVKPSPKPAAKPKPPPTPRPTRALRQLWKPHRGKGPKPGGVPIPTTLPRPAANLLHTVPGRIVRLDLPPGSFNAGLAPLGPDRYVCVYRSDELNFDAVVLDREFNIQEGSRYHLGLTKNCADPRLLWTLDERLLLVYSSADAQTNVDCIAAAVIMKEGQLQKAQPWRVSPPSDKRIKNWMPFLHRGKVYAVGSVRPHQIYELDLQGGIASLRYETDWVHPWFYDSFFRGNTNIVALDNGTYLGTFHTVVRNGPLHYYDNGCYVFDGEPPFRVLRCSRQTYLPAEAAVEPHFRKAGQILVTFPVGLVREGERLLISYGDNDSSVKILITTVADMLETTVPVYAR